MLDSACLPVPIDLRIDRRAGPLCTDNPSPTFSWRLPEGAHQNAYQVRLLGPEDQLLWTGERVFSHATSDIPYLGPALQACSDYAWQVRIWGGTEDAGAWSAHAPFETAILDSRQWSAQWVGGQAGDRAATYLRGTLDLSGAIARARAYVSALGWYRFFVNGADKTGNAQVPRWTPFDHIIEYQVYDVTADLQQGRNILAMAIGDGRYRGHTGFADKREIFGDTLAGLVQLRVEYADGSIRTFGSDTRWHVGAGRIRSSDPKRGETVDLRIPEQDWLLDADVPDRFAPARLIQPPTHRLVAEEVARVGAFRHLPAQRVWRSPSGKVLVDFGQNIAGVVRLRIAEPTGTEIRLVFSEIIGRDGELDTKYLMGKLLSDPPQTDRVISAGRDECWQPWFTTHGFRFLEVSGLSRDPEPGDFEAIVLSTELDYIGSFSCSDARLNRLVENVRWSMISNFVDTPTDCPTRERSGWTGDIQVFTETASLLADVQPYLRRYLRNLALDQCANGAVPPYIPGDATRHAGPAPRVLRQTVDSAGWGDAAVMIPHELYREYGDRAVLDRQYDSMRRWVDHLASLARRSPGRGRLFPRRLRNGLGRYIVDSGYHWGEWLRPGEDMVLTSIKHRLKAPAVVATAYLANSAKLISEIAGILGRTDDAGSYGRLADKVREAWCLAFVRDGGARIGDDRQDDYVRALAFDLLPEGQRGAAAGRLAELVEAKDYHLGTGFLSTPLLLPVLARFGRPDLAYRLLLQDTSPSWLHQVEKGATTTWESWEGYDRHGNARYSHNHYAFGTVVAWLFRGVAGISPIEAGYRRIRFAPILGGELTHAVAEVMTPFGRAACHWRRNHGAVDLEVTVPPGAEGEVHLGDGRVEQVDAGTFAFTWKEIADTSPACRTTAAERPRTLQKVAIIALALGGTMLAARLQYRRHRRTADEALPSKQRFRGEGWDGDRRA